MNKAILVSGIVLLVSTIAIASPVIRIDLGSSSSAEDARFEEVISPGDIPGYSGDGGVSKFQDGPVTCYVTNGDKKAGLSCLVIPKEGNDQ